jgi:hypothetical protein
VRKALAYARSPLLRLRLAPPLRNALCRTAPEKAKLLLVKKAIAYAKILFLLL